MCIIAIFKLKKRYKNAYAYQQAYGKFQRFQAFINNFYEQLWRRSLEIGQCCYDSYEYCCKYCCECLSWFSRTKDSNTRGVDLGAVDLPSKRLGTAAPPPSRDISLSDPLQRRASLDVSLQNVPGPSQVSSTSRTPKQHREHHRPEFFVHAANKRPQRQEVRTRDSVGSTTSTTHNSVDIATAKASTPGLFQRSGQAPEPASLHPIISHYCFTFAGHQDYHSGK
ncbi:hypothetical protein EJ02DRAFT_507590 [Clathrospora elynae]|uniref:Uncharacterized protein n=1 Tax=Clathrospora elynae TaxID=706981 RepID=A0A6A5T6N7_9PLEO|nr:hypothetical protein EJ02DRAFT_507590 [Clathrospora elynae]